MSLPTSLRASVTPPELELIATEELVDIVPLMAMDRISFISVRWRVRTPSPAPKGSHTTLDGCHAQAEEKMPYSRTRLANGWCASSHPPTWRPAHGTHTQKSISLKKYTKKRPNPDSPTCRSVSQKFRACCWMCTASDDLANPDKLRSLLQDLREARQAKARLGLENLEHSSLGLSNLCSMEINEIRPIFIQSMAILGQLRPGA
ncbi:DNA replication complex GINS protein PSF2 [Mycena kentingensis (nom. inval.)]|nr:DNA replication complex GINS protein PSF2 [Mycena kentingensis (nom. inval.)]